MSALLDFKVTSNLYCHYAPPAYLCLWTCPQDLSGPSKFKCISFMVFIRLIFFFCLPDSLANFCFLNLTERRPASARDLVKPFRIKSLFGLFKISYLKKRTNNFQQYLFSLTFNCKIFSETITWANQSLLLNIKGFFATNSWIYSYRVTFLSLFPK